VIENDFGQLISLLTIDPDALALMVEMSIQMEQGNGHQDIENLEEQKDQAIAKCRRRIDAARALFEDGDLTREEYLKRKEQNEREIAHWESRTTETQKAAIELAMCMDYLRKFSQL
jgi:hypothetical protein